MSYLEFIQMNPWFDFIFEMVKGLGPILVAIIAIVVNQNSLKKKFQINSLEKLVIRVYEIYGEVYYCVLEFLNSVYSSVNSIEKDITVRLDLEEYYKKKKYITVSATIILRISKLVAKKLNNEEISFKKVYDDLIQYLSKIDDITYNVNEKLIEKDYAEINYNNIKNKAEKLTSIIQTQLDNYAQILTNKIS